MAFTNFDTKEINCKILYLGPPGSGKSSNLKKILELTSPELGVDLVSTSPNPESSEVFFEFLPLSLGYVKDFHIKLHLYTLPQNDFYETLLPIILKGVDGYVFVADSSVEKLADNIETFERAKVFLTREGILPFGVPAVFQYNKRDLSSATPTEVLSASLNVSRAVEIEAQSSKGIGVLETLKEISQQVVRNIAG